MVIWRIKRAIMPTFCPTTLQRWYILTMRYVRDVQDTTSHLSYGYLTRTYPPPLGISSIIRPAPQPTSPQPNLSQPTFLPHGDTTSDNYLLHPLRCPRSVASLPALHPAPFLPIPNPDLYRSHKHPSNAVTS